MFEGKRGRHNHSGCQTRSPGSAIAENARRVPDSIAPALDIVAKDRMARSHGAPVAGRLPPAIHAIYAGLDEVFVRPTLGDDLLGHSSISQLGVNPLESGAPVVVSLDLDIRLVIGMLPGFTGQNGVEFALVLPGDSG